MIFNTALEYFMSAAEQNSSRNKKKISRYQIVIAGELHESWSDWLGKVEFERIKDGSESFHTILLSEVPDQAALRGLLNQIWDLNLELISLNKHNQGAADEK
jgi:hypothetical protein